MQTRSPQRASIPVLSLTVSRRLRYREPAARLLLAIGLLVGVSGCTTEIPVAVETPADPTVAISTTAPIVPASVPATTVPPTTVPATTVPTTTVPATTVPPTTVPATTVPPTTLPPLDVFDPACVVQVPDASSIERVASERKLDVVGLWSENGFVDGVDAGGLVDVCINNDINDIDGAPRPAVTGRALDAAIAENVKRQQSTLNAWFEGLGLDPLTVDGVSGPRTGQGLCAARVALGVPVRTEPMAPGSEEQYRLMTSPKLPTPPTTATESERWVLIDKTCQVAFVGSKEAVHFVFPSSTGSAGYETRPQDRSRVFRYDPAIANNGWHDSTEYPVGDDNPLNGNLYKPLYFDTGQAIHGANNVPITPESKGCARLRVSDQEKLLDWLGLLDVQEELWRKSEINLTVNVQGEFVP